MGMGVRMGMGHEHMYGCFLLLVCSGSIHPNAVHSSVVLNLIYPRTNIY